VLKAPIRILQNTQRRESGFGLSTVYKQNDVCSLYAAMGFFARNDFFLLSKKGKLKTDCKIRMKRLVLGII
jgi:hypothetical protein